MDPTDLAPPPEPPRAPRPKTLELWLCPGIPSKSWISEATCRARSASRDPWCRGCPGVLALGPPRLLHLGEAQRQAEAAAEQKDRLRTEPEPLGFRNTIVPNRLRRP